MTTTQSIGLNRLVQAKANVRRTGATTGIEALMASIAAHGLRQNLNVRPTTGGRFEVIAGGRRLIALKKLARAGPMPADMPVPCVVLAEADNATEISLAENQLREAMHPDDQCEAFRSLTEDGMPVEDVAARFGVTPAVVRQRLKLAAVSPKLRALYRAGETSLAHMMALTLSDDHAAQERAYAEWGSPAGIRHALTRKTLRADSRLARFVGLEAYWEAGGAVLADLFNPEDGYLTDPGLLERLAEARLAAAAETVAAEGWSWVLPRLQRGYDVAYSRVYGTPQGDVGIAFAPEQLAQAGALVGIDYDGALTVERGLVRPQDARAMARAERGEAAARSDYSAALVTELTGHRTAALRLRLTQTPLVALAAVTHALVTACRTSHAPGSVLQLAVRTRDLAGVVADTTDCTAHAEMASVMEGWNERLPADAAALWDWLLGQDTATLLDVLATFAAQTVDAVHGKVFSGSLAHADRLADALDLDMTAHWQPTAAFMERLRKPVMAEALTESDHPALAADLAVMKKPLAAAKAADALAGSGWLPAVLRRQGAIVVNDNTPVEAGAEAESEDHDMAA